MSSLRDVLYLTLRQQIALVKNKSISSFELCKAYLDKIHTINKQYNCKDNLILGAITNFLKHLFL